MFPPSFIGKALVVEAPLLESLLAEIYKCNKEDN